MVLKRLHLLTTAAVDGCAHGNVIAENAEHWSNVIGWTIVLANFDSMPNVKLDSMPNVCNLCLLSKKRKNRRKIWSISNNKKKTGQESIDLCMLSTDSLYCIKWLKLRIILSE